MTVLLRSPATSFDVDTVLASRNMPEHAPKAQWRRQIDVAPVTKISDIGLEPLLINDTYAGNLRLQLYRISRTLEIFNVSS